MEKIKYITNKELLAEIHKSKNSYCFYEKPEYSHYDAIVPSLSAITPEYITQVYDKKFAFATKKNLELPVKENLVFRLMTDEHIPEETDLKKRKRNTEETSVRTCFHPFKHYIMRNGSPVEVGRSHCKEGTFSDVHGKMTNRLAVMLMLLVERYSRRANWRGYCVDEATEALTQRGWLNIDQINESDIILSYDMTEKHYKWSSIKSIFRDDYDGNMFHLTVRGMDALVTPGHKFVTDSGPKEVEYLLEKDKVILSGYPLKDGVEKYSDDFVEIVGWSVTEGHYNFRNKKPSIVLYQNEGHYADRIRGCLKRLGVIFTETPRLRSNSDKININFNLSSKNSIIQDILDVSPKRVLTMDFILSLTQRQKKLLIDTMIDADGWRTYQNGMKKNPHVGYCQKDKNHLDAFLALCTLAGYRCSYKKRDVITEVNNIETHVYNANIFTDRANFSRVENIDFHGAKRSGTIKGLGKETHPNEPTVPYKGRVWCPETEYGTFMARRNGTIWLSHNTYNDEMRSHALLQLSEVGLRFNESKSDNPNPFAFYTTIIKNCFTRILNNEKKVQHIRDDLLIMADKSPSYTRQIEHEAEQKSEENKTDVPETTEKTVVPKKRGRKPKSEKIV
jgi:hypothetical protein